VTISFSNNVLHHGAWSLVADSSGLAIYGAKLAVSNLSRVTNVWPLFTVLCCTVQLDVLRWTGLSLLESHVCPVESSIKAGQRD
jgi:hypothetical protein